MRVMRTFDKTLSEEALIGVASMMTGTKHGTKERRHVGLTDALSRRH